MPTDMVRHSKELFATLLEGLSFECLDFTFLCIILPYHLRCIRIMPESCVWWT